MIDLEAIRKRNEDEKHAVIATLDMVRCVEPEALPLVSAGAAAATAMSADIDALIPEVERLRKLHRFTEDSPGTFAGSVPVRVTITKAELDAVTRVVDVYALICAKVAATTKLSDDARAVALLLLPENEKRKPRRESR